MTPVIIIKNETASTAVFVDYWAEVKIYFFIFVANILVEVLFLMFVGTAPKPPSVIHLCYTSFLNALLKLDICIFQLLI